MNVLMTKLQRKSLFQEAMNCWLRYILAQPIEIDIRIVLLFTLQLFGMNHLTEFLERVKQIANNLPKIQLQQFLILENA